MKRVFSVCPKCIFIKMNFIYAENLPPSEKREKGLEIWNILDGRFWQFWQTDFGKTGFTNLLKSGMVLLPNFG